MSTLWMLAMTGDNRQIETAVKRFVVNVRVTLLLTLYSGLFVVIIVKKALRHTHTNTLLKYTS